MTEAKRKYVAKQKKRNSFSRALHAFDMNRIDGEATKAMFRLEACDELYDLVKAAVEQWAGRFETEEDINGADCVDWLSTFIENAAGVIAKAEGAEHGFTVKDGKLEKAVKP